MKKLCKFIPFLIVVIIISAGLIYCGGGDEEEDGECTSTTIAGVYTYNLFSGTGGITVSGVGIAVTANPFSVSGTIDSSSGDFTVDTFTSLNVAELTFGSFQIDVTQTLQFPEDARPNSGEVEVRSLAGDIITVTVVDNTVPPDGVSDGVDVQVNTDPSTFYSWTDFDENTLTDPNEQLAAFAFGAFEFFLEQVGFAFDEISLINSNGTVLEQLGSLTLPCDTILGTSPVSPNPGGITFTWIDFNPDGFLDFGDSFTLVFDQCWDDNRGSNEDDLFDGTANLNELFFSFDGNCRLTSFSLNDLQFVNFDLSETETDPGTGDVTITDTLTVNGSIGIFFNQ